MGTVHMEKSILKRDRLKALVNEMPKEELLYELADFFKVFGDTTRVKILSLLFRDEMCVGDIAGILGMNHSAISHQLKILKQTRLVHSRKEGKTVIYFLHDFHIKKIFDQGLVHVTEKA
jgi:DNA-binding transcriptional ArsR family regulator